MSSTECPKCAEETKVIDTRSSRQYRRRRRECCGCGYRFTTLEIPFEDEKIRISAADMIRKVETEVTKSIKNLNAVLEEIDDLKKILYKDDE